VALELVAVIPFDEKRQKKAVRKTESKVRCISNIPASMAIFAKLAEKAIEWPIPFANLVVI